LSQEPLVSVIVNCFNGEKYLHQAIDSILKQTYNNWEVIFWDNLSTDKSAKIFKSFKDNRLKYYCALTHDSILYKARNNALKKVNGDFVAFLDVDDWWFPEKLEKQILLFQDPKVGLVYGNLFRFFTKKNKKEIYRKSLPRGEIADNLLKDYVIGSPTYVIRKKTLESLKRLFDDRFHIIGDFDLNLRIAAKWKIDCIQNPVAVARIHGKNESLIYKYKEIEELKIWYEEMKSDPFFSLSKRLKQILLKILYLETIKAINDGRYKDSIFMIAKYPLSFAKLKLIIALLLPKFFLKKIQNY